jgi:hypothetical protein
MLAAMAFMLVKPSGDTGLTISLVGARIVVRWQGKARQ